MVSYSNKDLQDLVEETLPLHTLKVAALQDTTVLSEQSHTWEQLQLIYLSTYPPSTGIWVPQSRQ